MLAYLGRYTHRVAISNQRLRSCQNGFVTFTWKDYARGNYSSLMTLSTDEFMRRFLLHVLPRGFQRLRQFGLLANRHRRLKLQTCRTLLGVAHTPVIDALPADDQTLYQTLTGNSLRHCPACQTGLMQWRASTPAALQPGTQPATGPSTACAPTLIPPEENHDDSHYFQHFIPDSLCANHGSAASYSVRCPPGPPPSATLFSQCFPAALSLLWSTSFSFTNGCLYTPAPSSHPSLFIQSP